MKIFLDSAQSDMIKKYADSGLIDGITTNPTLIMRAGREQREVTQEICNMIKGPVSAEGIKQDAQGMIEEGREFAKWAKNIVVKIPMTEEGLEAVAVLEKEGIKTNVTLVFSANQALLAAKAGASYVSPFVGRLDDAGKDGMKVIAEIMEIFDNYEYKTEVIVASIRSEQHVKDAALIGADIATIPPNIFEKMFFHELTKKGIEKFLEDHRKTMESLKK